MTEPIKEQVKRQFGPNAANYVTSNVHAEGDDLALLPGIAGLSGQELVLDVATAVGHTALALAPHAKHVTGVDLTAEMLVQARAQAERRGITNVSFAEADAEHLPFPDRHFHLVTCRIAAHHFPAVGRFCQEAYRVLRAGGLLLLIDNFVPADDELDDFMNEMDKLRDPSHVRAYRLPEWGRFIESAGLDFSVAHMFDSPIEIEPWIVRLSVPEPNASEVRRRFAAAGEKVRIEYSITATHFSFHKAIMLGRKR